MLQISGNTGLRLW